MNTPAYIGRFAPSPTGPLHAGSLVAALASWLDARAHQGQWLVRIEDVDGPRCQPGAADFILQQLAAFQLVPDAGPVYQSQRSHLYQAALDHLLRQHLAYPCACTRADIAHANAQSGQLKPRHGELIYPGTCRPENQGLAGRPARAWRLKAPVEHSCENWAWHDRRLGPQTQNLRNTVGDFVIKRADGLWAYQLAVVVDDHSQHITHVVRGEDLADNTPRQQWLQHCLGLSTPAYLHTPLVLGPNAEKLSKQNGAQALDTTHPLQQLQAAGKVLGISPSSTELSGWLTQAIAMWAALYP